MPAQRTEHPASRLLRAISDPVRLRLLRELPEEEAAVVSVGELAGRLRVTDAVASQHLRVLADLGLVGVRRSGRSARYFVKGEALQAARQSLASGWPALFGPTSRQPELSARNQLFGKVVEINRGEVTAEVVIDIGGQVITGIITNSSINRLELKVGDVAAAVIKATDVMFLK